MAEKQIKSRVAHKRDIEANWLKATAFTPLRGELIIYEKDETHDYVRFKVGDGETLVSNLPFAVVQPDWNENDETAVGYIQNRTHYEETATVMKTQTVSGTITYMTYGYYSTDVWVDVEEGRSNYTINGEPAGIITIDANGETVQGLESASWRQEYFSDYGNMAWYNKTGIADPVEMTITYDEEVIGTVVHTLDEKYIPDTIARTSMIGDINSILDAINGEVI